MQKLTDAEKQEVLRFLEADSPCPTSTGFSCSTRSAKWSWSGTERPTKSPTSSFPSRSLSTSTSRASRASRTSTKNWPVIVRRPRASDEGLDQQAHLGRQQA